MATAYGQILLEKRISEQERFQAASHDLLFLEKWVDDLLHMNYQELDPPRVGSIDHFKQQARRYNACFSELIRKTSVSHPDLARLFKKVWRGTGHFVARLLSDYEFQLSKSGELEHKMKEMLEASHIKVFWNTKETEKAKIDFALQRAKSIEMESEAQLLREKTRRLQADNDRLRNVIAYYIEGLADDDFLANEGQDGESDAQETAQVGGLRSPRQHGTQQPPASKAMSPRGSLQGGQKPAVARGSLQAGQKPKVPPISPRPQQAMSPRSQQQQRVSIHAPTSPSNAAGVASPRTEARRSVAHGSPSSPPMSPHKQSSQHGQQQQDQTEQQRRTSMARSVASRSNSSSGARSSNSSLAGDEEPPMDEMARKTLNVNLLKADGQEKCQSLHVRNDHLDKLLQEIVSEGLKQEHYLTEMEVLLRDADLTSMFVALHKDSEAAALEAAELEEGPSPLVATATLSPARHGHAMVDACSQTVDHALVDVRKAVYDADMQSLKSTGAHVPMGLRPYMATFPQSLRIPSLGITINTIARMIFRKLREDQERDEQGLCRLEVPHFVYQYYKQLYGSVKIADMQVVHFVRALQQHRSSHKRVKLFSRLVGSDHVQAPAPLNLRDANFLMEAVRYLDLAGEFARINVNEAVLDSLTLRRQRVMGMAEYLFGSFLPDAGLAFARRMESMPGPTDTQLDFDDVLEEVARQWSAANSVWRSHLTYLFKRFCRTFVVLDEVVFANDAGQKDRDTVLVEVLRDKVKRSKPRPLRKLLEQQQAPLNTPRSQSSRSHGLQPSSSMGRMQAGPRSTSAGVFRPDDEEGSWMEGQEDEEEEEDLYWRYGGGQDGPATGEGPDGSGTVATVLTVNDPSNTGGTKQVQVMEGEPIVELMDRDFCRQALRKIDHRLDDAWVSSFFDEACERMLLRTKRALEDLWQARTSSGTGSRPAETTYVCPSAGIVQSTAPYELKTFRTYDIDLETFIDLALEHEILVRCPFVRLLDKPSDDLWSNRDVYLAQLQEGTIRQPQAGPSITIPGCPSGYYTLDPELVRRPEFDFSLPEEQQHAA